MLCVCCHVCSLPLAWGDLLCNAEGLVWVSYNTGHRVCVSVCVMQSASLCLTCTPPEELAVGLRTLLKPLASVRVAVNEIGGTPCFIMSVV